MGSAGWGSGVTRRRGHSKRDLKEVSLGAGLISRGKSRGDVRAKV